MTEFFQAITDNILGVSICGVSLATILGLIVAGIKILTSSKFAKRLAELDTKNHISIENLKVQIINNLKEVKDIMLTLKVMIQNNVAPNEIVAYITTILSQQGNEEMALEYEKNLASVIETEKSINLNEMQNIEVEEEISIVQEESVTEDEKVEEVKQEEIVQREEDEEMIVNA